MKGATMKGLTNPANKNRLFIEDLIRDDISHRK
jgi:hypothetical protein